MMVLFFPHIPLVVNHTINATPPERLQQYQGLKKAHQISFSILNLFSGQEDPFMCYVAFSLSVFH